MSAAPTAPADLAAHLLGLIEADEARVVASHTRAGLTRFAESHIHQHVGEDATTVQLTVVRDGRVASVSSTDSSADGLARLAARAVEVVAAAPVDGDWPGLAGPTEAADPGHVDDSTIAATGEDRARIVADFVTAGGGNAAGFCSTDVQSIALADSAGALLTGQATSATLDGIHRLDGNAAGSAHQSSVALADLDGLAAGVRARRLAELGTIPAEFAPGRIPVVLGPEAVATIAIFLSVYGCNAKMHAEGQSGFRLGEAQFDPSLQLVDDPLEDRSLGVGFDLEGTAHRRLPLIVGGVSTALAHDRRSARLAGTSSTGHGGPGSASQGPVATSLLLGPADGTTAVPVAELAAGMSRGLLITSFNYCRILDPKTIGVTGLTRNGTFLVSGGRLVGSVGNVRFTQSFLDALGPGVVEAIGDDGRLADSEFGPGMTHVPSLRLARWNITGDGRG